LRLLLLHCTIPERPPLDDPMTTLWLAALAGFSTGIAALLAIGMLSWWRHLSLPLDARAGGLVMLTGLSFTSWRHLQLAGLDHGQLPAWNYSIVLCAQSLGFYLLLLGVLDERDRRWRRWLPALLLSSLAALLPPPHWRVPVAMALGTAYALHLGALLWRLRGSRRWFRIELPVIASFASMGLIVAALGLAAPGWVDWSDFALAYSAQIALGFAMVSALLVGIPDLVEKTREAVAVSQATTALARVDVEAAVSRVRQALEVEAAYRDESLTLAKMAVMVGLSTHQLSELVNRHFGVSFSRLLRRHRVAAARQMLIDEPRASVLSVGLAAGFASQSTFYVAFKDELGVVPGEFRRRCLGEDPAAAPD
jgi:AraC-like DNA-binding protein